MAIVMHRHLSVQFLCSRFPSLISSDFLLIYHVIYHVILLELWSCRCQNAEAQIRQRVATDLNSTTAAELRPVIDYYLSGIGGSIIDVMKTALNFDFNNSMQSLDAASAALSPVVCNTLRDSKKHPKDQLEQFQLNNRAHITVETQYLISLIADTPQLPTRFFGDAILHTLVQWLV
jgi:hypothetical protein